MNLFEDQTRSLNPIKMLVKSILIGGKLDTELDLFQIKQDFEQYE